MKTLIVYNGGACGDLISAILDVSEAHITDEGRVRHNPNREKLKKPHLFDSNIAKDRYLAEAFLHYNSLPSHDIEYHINREHDFIGIAVKNIETAKWAATRFRLLHDDIVWQEMVAKSGVNDVNGYAQMMLDFSNLVASHTKNVLLLEDILQGTATERLADLTGEPISIDGQKFYQQWLLHNIK